MPTTENESWQPEPVDVGHITLSAEYEELVTKFAEHFHDSWASRKVLKACHFIVSIIGYNDR